MLPKTITVSTELELDTLVDLITSEYRSIESGETSYGSTEDDTHMKELLGDFLKQLKSTSDTVVGIETDDGVAYYEV